MKEINWSLFTIRDKKNIKISRSLNYCFSFLILILLVNCSSKQPNVNVIVQKIPKNHIAYFTSDKITVDGKDDENVWKEALWSDSFIDIEGEKTPKFKTQFKMLWDDKNLYFYSKMEDPHIWASLKQRDTVVFYNNDFEIFIDPNGDTHNYMEIELNAYNTLWDLFLTEPYRNNATVLNQWDIKGFQSNVYVSGTLNDASDIDNYWSVEIAIPWISLQEEIGKKTPILGQTWRINFSRVHWEFDLIDGMYYRKKDNKGDFLPEYNWVWSPQGVINMHQPEKWGFVHFAKKIAEKDQPKFQYPDDNSLILWMYSQYRSQLDLINDSSKSKSIFPIKGSIESQTVTLEKIKYPNGYFLMAKSPKTNIVYYINEQGKLISKP